MYVWINILSIHSVSYVLFAVNSMLEATQFCAMHMVEVPWQDVHSIDEEKEKEWHVSKVCMGV